MDNTNNFRLFCCVVDGEEMEPELSFLLVVLIVVGYPLCAPVVSSEPTCTSDSRCRDDINSQLKACFGPDVQKYFMPSECDTHNPDHCSDADESAPDPGEVDIEVQFVPVSIYRFNVSVRLPQAPGVQQYDLRVTIKDSTLASTMELFNFCACTSVTRYNFTLSYNNERDPIDLGIVVKTFPGGHLKLEKNYDFPRHCADHERRIPYDTTTCGLPRLQKPTILPLYCNGTHTTISWNKTVSYISPVNQQKVWVNVSRFYLVVVDEFNDKKCYDVNNATEVTVNTTKVVKVSLHAFDKCSGLYERKLNLTPYARCSVPAWCSNTSRGDCSQKVSCYQPSVTSTAISAVFTPLPTSVRNSPKQDEDHLLPIYYAAGAAGGILVLVATVIIVMLVIRWRVSISDYGLIRPPSPSQRSALIIYSPSTPEEEKRVILQSFVKIQNKVKIEFILQDLRKPRISLVDWISQHYKNAGTVFYVCNEEFQCDWENSRPLSEDSAVAVQTLRLLFQGDLTSVQLRKYAVVLSKPTDEVFVPELLKALPQINLSDTPNLMKFAGRETSPV